MKKKETKDKLTKKVIQECRKNFNDTFGKLEEAFPQARCELNYGSPFQLLVATILSAQCTDKRVNMVTPALFDKYPDARTMAVAPLGVLMKMVKSTGFFRNKAKNIKGAATMIVKDYGGTVPDEMGNLLALPGVARKTANVLLWNAFGKNEGVVVDTHVGRIAYRLGLTGQTSPAKIERDLMELVPRKDWGQLSHLFIFLGRSNCRSQSPLCGGCPVRQNCPWYDKVIKNSKAKVINKAPKTHNI